MKINKLVSVIALSTSSILMSTSSEALTSFTNLIVTSPLINIAEDSSGENAYRLINGTWQQTGGNLQVGDILAGVAAYNGMNGTPIGGASTYTGLTAVFATQIASITNTSSVPLLGQLANFTFTSAATSAWDAIFGLTANQIGGQTLLNGTMIAYLQDTNNSFGTDDFTNVAGAIAAATAATQTMWAQAGFGTGLDHFWSAANAPVNISNIGLVPVTTKVGDYTFGLDVLQNLTGLDFVPVNSGFDYMLYNGAGQIYKPGAGNAFGVEDDIKTTFLVNNVPEPNSIGLMLMGGLIFVFSSLRRRKSI
jgi:hypothetical protein